MKVTINKLINLRGFGLIFTKVKILFNAWLIIDLFAHHFLEFQCHEQM